MAKRRKTCAGCSVKIFGDHLHCLLERAQLPIGEDEKERLQNNDGFTQAGVEIIVERVQRGPIHTRLDGNSLGDLSRNIAELQGVFLGCLGERMQLVKKTRAGRKQDAAENAAASSQSLGTGASEIFRNER